MNLMLQETLADPDDLLPIYGTDHRCGAEQVSEARARRNALRSRLGVMGSGGERSLDDVLAEVIRDGDAFAKWREGTESLKNLQIVQRRRGVVTPISYINSHTPEQLRIDVTGAGDSQIEIWECGDEMECRFPVFRLPLSTMERGRSRKIKERLRSDALLTLDIKFEGDSACFAVSLNASSVTSGWGSRNTGQVFNQIRYRLAGLSRLCEGLKSTFRAIVEYRSAPLYPWQLEDVRNDPLYRLGDMWQPAMCSH